MYAKDVGIQSEHSRNEVYQSTSCMSCNCSYTCLLAIPEMPSNLKKHLTTLCNTIIFSFEIRRYLGMARKESIETSVAFIFCQAMHSSRTKTVMCLAQALNHAACVHSAVCSVSFGSH